MNFLPGSFEFGSVWEGDLKVSLEERMVSSEGEGVKELVSWEVSLSKGILFACVFSGISLIFGTFFTCFLFSSFFCFEDWGRTYCFLFPRIEKTEK